MIILAAIAGVVIVLGVVAVGIYNSLVRNKTMVEEAWSGIDVQLKRRHDLIPNLVKTVEGYTQHERQLFENLARWRSQSMSASSLPAKAEAETQITQGLRQLFALAEAYPELKANQNFLDLQSKLSEVEDQLQLARRYYNGSARNLNILVGTFPSSLIAARFHFERVPFFEAEAGDKAVPEVRFTPS